MRSIQFAFSNFLSNSLIKNISWAAESYEMYHEILANDHKHPQLTPDLNQSNFLPILTTYFLTSILIFSSYLISKN